MRKAKFFFYLENSNAIKKHIRKLNITDNVITTDPQVILQEQERFYKNLLTSKLEETVDDSPSFTSRNIPILSQELYDGCEGLVTTVLKSFKTNKSPGNDGLSIEFYIYFWEKICETLIQCYNYVYEFGELSHSQKQAIISVLHKKGKDRLFLKNWRPISLLNVDYKSISKVIAQRIKNVLTTLVNKNQSGFIEDRFIGDTIRTLLDIIAYTDETNMEGLLMMIDFEKAYDSVEFKTLDSFGFGPMLINWVKVFHANTLKVVS